ncbi:uncharacterized protein LOC116413751 [Galleria mellonella]|uniref:Uncharacterized protein LOC116413751 n=1 Tax=Galleria mellonella TaxID=7137 RepID=A0A6J3CD40_GALME|nr:uncharacterized protein LOC116413751 [Galleria mellonella]
MKEKFSYLLVSIISINIAVSSPFNVSNNIYQKLSTVQNGAYLSEPQDLSKTLKVLELLEDPSYPLINTINTAHTKEESEAFNKILEGKKTENESIKENKTGTIEKIIYADTVTESTTVSQDVKNKQTIPMKKHKNGKDLKTKSSALTDLKTKTTASPNKKPTLNDGKPTIIEMMNKKLKLNATINQNFELPPTMIPIFKPRSMETNYMGNREIDPNFILPEPITDLSNSTTDENKIILNQNIDLIDHVIKANPGQEDIPNTSYVIKYLQAINGDDLTQNSEIKPGIQGLDNSPINGVANSNFISLQRHQDVQSERNHVTTNKNNNPYFKMVEFIPIGDIQNAGFTNAVLNDYNIPNSNIIHSNSLTQNQQISIAKLNENAGGKQDFIPKTSTFYIPCQKASDVLNDAPASSISCASLTEANVESVIKDLSANFQKQHLDEKVASLKTPNNSVAILFKTKEISLLKLYGDLLKKITITVLVPYHISKLGQEI